jgi:hypothetical protein
MGDNVYKHDRHIPGEERTERAPEKNSSEILNFLGPK